MTFKLELNFALIKCTFPFLSSNLKIEIHCRHSRLSLQILRFNSKKNHMILPATVKRHSCSKDLKDLKRYSALRPHFWILSLAHKNKSSVIPTSFSPSSDYALAIFPHRWPLSSRLKSLSIDIKFCLEVLPKFCGEFPSHAR